MRGSILTVALGLGFKGFRVLGFRGQGIQLTFAYA